MGSEQLNVPLTPVVAFFLVASVLGGLLVQLDPQGLLWPYLLYTPVSDASFDLVYGHQYWRLLTPVFLHFGLLHITFNGLLLWILGTVIESRRGSAYLFVLLFLSGIVSNVAQYWYTSYPLFGGLSGALFGLAGYVIVCNTLKRAPHIAVPPGLLWMVVISMLLGLAGILNYILGVRVANGAHLSGFLTGVVLGLAEACYLFFAAYVRRVW